jgi:aspartyl/asparaginyl beta-hydroxylase (cupin superfamily)
VLKHYGEVDYDFSPLIKRVKAISEWTFRLDPESYKTCKVREGDASFPKEEIKALFEKVDLPSGFQNRVVLSCVPAGEEILPHTDDFGEAIRNSSIHCHIPLITHESVVMGFDSGETHLKAGHLYSMDETKRHWVKNPSDVDRVHLLFAHFPH